jgi:hypothetical protein
MNFQPARIYETADRGAAASTRQQAEAMIAHYDLEENRLEREWQGGDIVEY